MKKKFLKKDENFKSIKKSFEELQYEYYQSNAEMIENFNSIYFNLMSKSTCKAFSAHINEDICQC